MNDSLDPFSIHDDQQLEPDDTDWSVFEAEEGRFSSSGLIQQMT